MKTVSIMECCSTDAVLKFAKKNYLTYVAHYKARNLKPMSLNEFLKNYGR